MKKTQLIASVAAIVFACFCLMGMAGGISQGQGTITSPFDAKIMDTMHNQINISSVTFDGKTIFSATMGKGKVQIPFENIERIDAKDDTVCLKLVGAGTMCNLKINSVSKIYGKTSYGTYQISFKDIVWVELTKAKP